MRSKHAMRPPAGAGPVPHAAVPPRHPAAFPVEAALQKNGADGPAPGPAHV